MSAPRILIAGIGNIFLGDDAFGVEVAQMMIRRPLPDGVRVVDFGIRGLDLAYALLETIPTVIIVDAVPRGEPPGTLYLIEPDVLSLQGPGESDEMIDAHSMDPMKVLRSAASMGAKFGKVLLIGCEPTPFDAETDMQMELTPPVRNAVDEAIAMIESLVQEILRDERNLAGAGATSRGQMYGAAKEMCNETGS
ncbi:MAG: hydrogenase maturation protease [Tepidisphaeraceae bacterium]|jgi:hydrogenase maturation protease